MPTEEPRKPGDVGSEAEAESIENAQLSVSRTTTEVTSVTATATSGTRQVFRDIRRQLAEDDLATKGVQKLLLSELETSEGECEALRAYIERFHEADKRAATLEERLKTNKSVEIMFDVSLAVGGALIGLSPALWDHSAKAPLALTFGIVLIASSAIAKALKR